MKTVNMMQHEVVNVPSNIMILGAAFAIVIVLLVDDPEIRILTAGRGRSVDHLHGI
jgi:hypothetical protein